ncbi:protein transport protein Sec31A-like isoform X2 [Acipenser oxyrinchus oxyrinchus]|uniref:Protein transport protein Sec31A n=1 Tax=Acipenser oxyrinchus oxyrinchus TaxID=40147 RepID=A0AAD8D8K2_ACIOX|nr:protein transport protein Sec31A-like isoform X2 [Acipenser oxyrinchus oxyrinchus]
MKLKEIQRTANQAWSPASRHPTYLATGTSAQQLDASFSTSAALEIFELDFSDPSLDMKLRGSLSTTNRFHSLIWVNFGAVTAGSGGMLVGGGDNGAVTLYNPTKILASEKEAIVGQCEKHTGPVRTLDFNPFKSNLLASGANDSEIYIWDLNNFSNPMTPGAKSQPLEDVSVVAWNRQVQHILASAHPSGKAVVWDLRKNEPIIKISDHSNRMHCSGMLWHPEVATQLVLASEDDRLPVIQIWDLRFASSPLKLLENHTRGILSISWSQADPELLLSSAKDNRILCWNPGTGEVIYELPTSSQWCFDVQWCPRNPAILSAASFDGRISIYSVMGGSLDAQGQGHVDKFSSSFDAMDPFGTGQSLPPLQVPQKVAQTKVILPLKKPPKWTRRPVGASFAFGGKLITFENPKPAQEQVPQPIPRHVFISQVTTETEFLQRSSELQSALHARSFSSYCQAKIQKAATDSEENIWSFLKVNFEDDARSKFLQLLGYSKEELEKKIASCLGKSLQPNGNGVDANDLAEKIQILSAQRSDESSAAGDTSSSPTSSTQSDFFSNLPNDKPKFQISTTTDTDGLISQALLVGNFEGAVDLCFNDARFADAIILAISGGEELLKKTQQRYLAKQKTGISMLVSSIVNRKWTDIVQSCDLENWKEALAALLTYARPEEFSELCDILGSRLEREGEERMCLWACLCYICSGNIEKLVECWVLKNETSSPLALEDLVEKVMVLRKSIEQLHGGDVGTRSTVLAEKLTQYANLLAAQGSLAAAMSYLPASSSQALIMQLRDRLFHAQGEAVAGQQPPPFPYNRVQVGGGARPVSTAAPAQQSGHRTQQQGPYQPAFHPQMQPSGQPPVFTPQPTSTDSMPPSGMPAISHGPPAGIFSRPPYPRHPVTASAFSQPFSQPGGPPSGQAAFPTHPPCLASSLSGPEPVAAQPSGLPSMPGPTMSGPTLRPPASVPSYQPSGPFPPSSQAAGLPPMFSGGARTPTSMPASQPPTTYPLGPGYPQGGPGAPAAKTFAAASLPPPPTGSQEGWNDPPNVRGGPRKKKLHENYAPPAPITAPVMNFSMEHKALQPQASLPQETIQAPPGAPKEANIQTLHQLPAEKIEKKEIPQEHLVLKTTFDGLLKSCLLAAGDPQTKRKLDDASKRLEYLYDKLREQTLTPNILGGLHEIGRCIEGRNYQQALAVHTQIVSSSNFSDISAFMPILKVVMTIANKLSI